MLQKQMKRFTLLGISLGLLLIFLFFQLSGFATILDLKSLDLFRTPHAPHPDIVIIAIDNKSLSEIGRWPWKRSIHAEILENLASYNPSILAYDVTFIDRENTQSDTALSQAFKGTSFPIVLAGQAIYQKGVNEPSQILEPIPEFRESDHVHVGLANIFLSPDGLARSFPEEITKNDTLFLPLSFEIVKLLKGKIPDDKTLVSYAGSSGTFQTYSAVSVLKKELPKEALEGKIVLLGATAGDLRDIFVVPGIRQILPGVEYHANVLDNILLNRGIKEAPKTVSFAIGIFIYIICVLCFFFISSRKTLILAITFAICLPLGSFIAWQLGYALSYIGTLLFVLSFILVQGLYRWYTTHREKRQLRLAFQNYFSPQILEHILKNPENLSLGGKKTEITVLFSDLRNFTTLSETISPEELTEFLNDYFTEMTEEILATDGVVDKFIGDAIMAFWGAPLEQPDQADRALTAAKGMIARLEKLQKHWKEKHLVDVKMGVGINSGVATIGNLGSEKRFDYTAIGNTVNVASRLEGLTKEYDCSIILSEETRKKITLPESFRSLGDVKVKGKTMHTSIFTLK